MNIFLDLSKALYELEHSIIIQQFKNLLKTMVKGYIMMKQLWPALCVSEVHLSQ